jgi:hypothetical protein
MTVPSAATALTVAVSGVGSVAVPSTANVMYADAAVP